MALVSFRHPSELKNVELDFSRNRVIFRNSHVSVTTSRLALPAAELLLPLLYPKKKGEFS
jgi:hypothetical protein